MARWHLYQITFFWNVKDSALQAANPHWITESQTILINVQPFFFFIKSSNVKDLKNNYMNNLNGKKRGSRVVSQIVM
jgi:hypothetical protein